MDQAVIELQGITKVFETEEVETHALSDVHLTIRPGEYVSIEGPSRRSTSTSYRAGSSNALQLRAQWQVSRRFCSPTSRPAISTPRTVQQ